MPFASYPAVRIMLLMVLGIVVAHYTSISLSLSILLLTFFFVIFLVAEFVIKKRYSVTGARVSIICYLFIITFSSAYFYGVKSEVRERGLSETEKINLFEWEEIETYGTVISSGFSSSGREVYIVEAESATLQESITWQKDFRIRLYGNSEKILNQGSLVNIIVRLYAFPERRNPHEFDYGKWLHAQGITAHGELVKINSVERKSVWSWFPIRSYVRNSSDRLFKAEYSPMAKALLLGYKEELDSEMKREFSRSGLSHIMAVSGLHVGFVVAPFWLIIPFLWTNKYGKWAGIILLTLLLFGYAGITGFSASVNRASVMAWLITYGKLFHKVRNSINLTAVAAIILLIINPEQLFNVGFQLSFAAVFIILLLMPEAQRLVPRKIRYGKAGGLMAIILVSIVVQLGLFPILIYYFGEFSIAGPVANALVVPLLSFTVPAGIVMILLSSIHLSFFELASLPVSYSMDWISGVAKAIGSFDYSYLVFEKIYVSLFLIWFTVIMFISAFRISQYRWKWLILILVSMNLLAVEIIIKKPAQKKMEVTFLDVNQGDAIHIKTPNDKHILVDAGRWSPFANSGDRVLLAYFEQNNIDHLDAIILSHPHSDHIGGIITLIENITIGTIYQSDYEYDSALFINYMTAAEENDIVVKTPKTGDTIHVDESIRLFVLGPENNNQRPRNPNNRSLSVKLVYGENSILFTGDAETEQERELATRYGEFLVSTVYKAGHHGSNTSSTEQMMNFVRPVKSVVSLAFNNQFGHPGSNAVVRMNNFGDVYYTSLEGAVKIVSDGQRMSKVEWK